MKRAMLLVGTLVFGMLLCQTLNAGDEKKDKVHEVGKGLSIKGKLSADVKNITYKVKLQEGKTYVIDMLSPDQMALDPYLYLKDAGGKLLAEDDDGGEGLNSKIVFECKKSGTYQIIASSFQESGIGDYTLEVAEKK
ncbi:MAG: PPC domain-containing protein [Planctomycetes bacterium]|nr:PPC domain-containing protein [Planctomycetota bacterium]